jgi:hypothetical protein
MPAFARWFTLLAVIGTLFVSSPAGAQWRPGGVPVAPIDFQDLPRVASDGAGGMYVVWRDHRDLATNSSDVYLQHLTGDGVVAPGWPTLGVPVAASERPEFGWVASDGFGGALVAWEKAVSVVSQYDIFLQRILPDGSIAPGWSAGGVPISLAPDFQFFNSVVGDGAGGAYVSWTDHRDANSGDVQAYLTHITADGQLADGWTPDGTMLIQNQPGTRSSRALLEGPGGDVYVLFGDSRLATALGGTYSVIRLTPEGAAAPGWPVDGLPLLLGGTGGEYSGLVSDGAGGVIAGWNDFRYGIPAPFVYDYDIFAQHVFADGTLDPRWPRDGFPVCDDPEPQYNFTMAADGFGGAVFAWEDARSGSYWQPFAHRVQADATLAPGWPVNGRLLSGLVGTQIAPFVVADGSGGLYAFWEQFPVVGYDIGSQHLLAGGERASGWPENGFVIGTPESNDYDPYCISDGKGGALIAYTYGTPAAERVYAQRIAGDGPVSTRVSWIAANAEGGTVTLRWHSAEAAGLRSSVERRPAEPDVWSTRGTPVLQGNDVLEFVDREVVPGTYAYRLRYADGLDERLSEEIVIEVTGAGSLALGGFRPNPAVGTARVHFTLPDDRPASVEVFDLRGRSVFSRAVGSLGPGTHSIALDGAGALASGVYWIRLVHPERTISVRGVIARG